MIASWSALKFPEKFNTRVRAFASDDSGAMVILALFFFVIMLAAAGLGVDTMRHEMQRTHIQATLDSAVLAGAGAPAGATKEDIKDIVEDYFDAAGLQEYLHEIDPDKDIDAGINSKRVTASASMTMNTLLMKLSGVDTLNAGGGSTAAIASPKMEIVLALDVSGSMAGTRLTKMKEAAKEFVSDVLNKSDEGSTTIAIGDIREPPDIAQADRRTDRSEEKGASAGETLTPLGLSSGSPPTCDGCAGLRRVRHVDPFVQ